MTDPQPGEASRFTVRPITDLAAWRTMAGEWDRVLRATVGYTPLQSFDFLSTWWECLGGDRALWILAFHDGHGALAGIAPLQISRRRLMGKRYRVVEFLGMTEDILVPTLLFPPRERAQLSAALIDYLARHRSAWELIELDELAATDPLLEDLRTLARRCGLIHREQLFHDCPFLDLAGQTPESFHAACSRKLLKNLRASERRLGELGPVSTRLYHSAEEIGAGLSQFWKVERHSWKRQAALGMSADARYELFYGRLLERFAQRHQARVVTLSCGDQPVAATIAIVFDRIYCSLQIVHDERQARFSPGTLLELHELEGLVGEGGIRRYEFLGGALTNKLRWTSTAIATRCLSMHQPEIRTRLLDLYQFRAKPAARRALRRMGIFRPSPASQAVG